MNKNKHLPKSLPEKNPYFSIDVVGEATKEQYTGNFETIIPNLRIQGKIAKYSAFLNGGFDASLDTATKNIHHMSAYCKMCIVECPEWFKNVDYGIDLYDMNVLETIYNNVLEKESEWIKSIWGDESDSSEKTEE